MSEFEPFDPDKHTAVDLPGGRKATEYLASEESPEGKAWNIPQIWFNTETGEAKFFASDKAWNTAQDYEKRTGNKFPGMTAYRTQLVRRKKGLIPVGLQKKAL